MEIQRNADNNMINLPFKNGIMKSRKSLILLTVIIFIGCLAVARYPVMRGLFSSSETGNNLNSHLIDSRAALIKGFWIDKSGNFIDFFDVDGTYVSILGNDSGKLKGRMGKWRITDFRIFSYSFTDPAGLHPNAEVVVFRKNIPNEPDVQELEGVVYEYVNENLDPNLRSKFGYIKKDGKIMVDNGDYMTLLSRMELE